jgi:hypothetical protein
MSFLKFINESFDKNYSLGSDGVQKTNKKRTPGKRTKLHESMLDIADKLEGVDSQHKLGNKRFPDECKNGKCTDEVLTEDRNRYKRFLLKCAVVYEGQVMDYVPMEFYFDTEEEMTNFIKNGNDEISPENIKVESAYELNKIDINLGEGKSHKPFRKNSSVGNANEVLTEDRDEYTDVVELIADYFNVPVEDITQSSWDDRVYELPDGEEYLVIHEDDVYDAVKDDIEILFDDIGMDSFTPYFQEWIMDYALDLDWFEDAQIESYEMYFNDIVNESSDTFESRAIEELYDAGIIDEDNFDTNDEGEVDYGSFDGDVYDYKDDFVDYMVYKSENPAEWFIGVYGVNELSNVIQEYNLIDMDKVTEECIDVDGAAHFLARYDGEEHEIGGPYLAYRQN